MLLYWYLGIGAEAESQGADVHAICNAVDTLRPDLPHSPCTSLITSVEDRPGHDRRYAIDFHKIRSEIGWQPRLTFAESITQTVTWYLEHPAWVQNIVDGGYRRTRLGLSRPAPSHSE